MSAMPRVYRIADAVDEWNRGESSPAGLEPPMTAEQTLRLAHYLLAWLSVEGEVCDNCGSPIADRACHCPAADVRRTGQPPP